MAEKHIETIDKERLKLVLSMIQKDKDQTYLSGNFDNLVGQLHIKVHLGDKKLTPLLKHLIYLKSDIWNIDVIISRLDWLKKLWIKDEIDNSKWMLYASVDIDMFHVLFRSLFDYLAKAIGFVSDKPGQVRSKSFESLKNWVNASESNKQKIGIDLADIVSSCEWFGKIRDIRDSIIHDGAGSIVFLEKGRILFQVHKEIFNKVKVPQELYYNENMVVDFELYSAMYMCYLFEYLERIGPIFYSRIGLKDTQTGRVQSYHGSLKIIENSIKKLLI